jgi:hypothetical protein
MVYKTTVSVPAMAFHCSIRIAYQRCTGCHKMGLLTNVTMQLQWNIDALLLKGMDNKNDKYRKVIVAGNH